ncbi:metallophosphoesterase [Chitinibacter bivalviorum]|uniref:Metallophosphoesterase n=1 Tax=Chitinibacter bivalviorum TaxID=2739434 RepID=A0A7H9BIE0_9NEIS|nr:metallophosphoesterase [Chitinibacter bivalviorum]QLG88046.1 metallophosphoesterase [Chitinibacter bivalviorum]
MKLWIMSDLHVDVYGYQVVPTEADLVILAGDIGEGFRGLNWANEQLGDLPVVYVPGNHEYYGFKLDQLNAEFEQFSQPTLQVLQRQSIVIGDIRFLGCTLWTDFTLFGAEQQNMSMILAKQYMADFSHIFYPHAGEASLFNPVDSTLIHQQDRAWLESELAKPFAGKTAVITHHGPHSGSLHPRYAEDLVSAGFLSDLTPLMGLAELWIHGHTHHSFDYHVNGTRVVCNPRGYASKNKVENLQFDPSLVIEL